MGKSRRLSVSRGVVWAIVIGGHVLLLVLISNSRPRDREATQDDSTERTILLLLDVAPPPEEQPAQEPEPDRTSITRPRAPATASADSASAPISAEAPPARAPVDWYREAERVAQDHAAELIEQNKQPCDASSSDRPGSILPKCRKHKSQREWEPEPSRAGFQGLLPYVRLGKRCVVGLGFFGCALGRLPEADGHVFDDMNDPDRPQSSVPDIPGHE
jgi:hypothetical protein